MQTMFINKFRGIRAVNPIVDVISTGEMSAVSTSNVELKFSNNGTNFGIYTMRGNALFKDFDEVWAGSKIVGFFPSIQSGVEKIFVYLTNEAEGRIYASNNQGGYTLRAEALSVSDVCNGITISQGFDDWFVFTNGVDKLWAFTGEDRNEMIDSIDSEGRDIRGLGLEAYDGRLVVTSKNIVYWSRVSDIFDFRTTEVGVYTNPAFQEFDRDVTGIAYYSNALVVFTEDNSVEFRGNPADANNFTRTGASGGGTPSHQSLIKFDNKIYYYDHNAKNIFAYYLYDSGQTRPTNGLATNIQDYFDKISIYDRDKVRIVSMIKEDISEIWIHFPTNDGQEVLIMDYIKGEFLARNMQQTTFINKIDDFIYSCNGSRLLKEYSGTKYDGEFRPCEYKMNIINLGSDSNLKIPKFPMVITLDSAYKNNFYIEFTYDDDPKTSRVKRVEKTKDGTMVWSLNYLEIEDNKKWCVDDVEDIHGKWDVDDSRNITYNLSGMLNFKQLQMRIFTEVDGEEFGIKRIEMKRIKTKTKTVG